MGRLVLFIVLAASLGASVITMAMRGTASATDAVQAQTQADVLAREVAESGLSLALAQMTRGGGLSDPGLQDVALRGGEFSVDFTDLGADQASVRVKATWGGAVHEIQNTYRYDPMDAPGPLWLDVPYGSGTMDGTLAVDGGPDRLPVRLDPRRHADYDLESFLPLAPFESALGWAANRAGGGYETSPAGAWAGERGLLGDLNVADTEELYHAALESFDAADGDAAIAGPHTVSGAASWGGAANVTHVRGGLTVGGSVSGSGVLVVDGDLVTRPGSSFTWDGLVLVRGTDDVLNLDLDGTVRVQGAVAVVHNGFPPGGHMDVSVYQDKDGMTRPHGDLTGANRQWGWRPWFEHTHRFDETPERAPRGRHVYYLENGGAGRHEAEVELAKLLGKLDADAEVYLEFANVENHGFSAFTATFAGRPAPVRGTVRGGFPADFRSATGGAHRSVRFRAGDLRSLDVEVRSLRSLQPMFNTGSSPCSDWPRCIGQDWDRKKSLAVRLMRADDGKRLYESTLYWHMKGREIAAHAAAEAEWRRQIEEGRTFGTRLQVKGDVAFAYRRGPINALAEKMKFDGDEVHLVTAAADHTKPSEPGRCADRGGVLTAAEGLAATLGLDATCADDVEGREVVVCHRGSTETFSLNKLRSHSDHTTVGPCPVDDDGDDGDDGDDVSARLQPTESQPLPSDPNAEVKVCRPDGGDPRRSWNDDPMPFHQVESFLRNNPHALYGTCSDHNK